MTGALSSAQFEAAAARAMSSRFGLPLSRRSFSGVPKTFDLVSADGSVAGDAKYYSLVGGARLAPAKFSVIAEYVWLLEHTSAVHKFLVFGNDERVPREWLKRYGKLTRSVKFFFLHPDGSLVDLREAGA